MRFAFISLGYIKAGYSKLTNGIETPVKLTEDSAS